MSSGANASLRFDERNQFPLLMHGLQVAVTYKRMKNERVNNGEGNKQ